MPAQSKKPNLDTVTSINKDGSHFAIHPADVRGPWMRWRRLSALLLIAIYVLLPWIHINGYPAVFLDVVNRRFHLFGFTLAAQDAWLLFFFVSGLAFFLFFITAFLGRVWCGWACPQTIFLEHVFRRIERWIEGDHAARRRLDRAPLSPSKLRKRVLKHAIFLLCATVIAHIFLSYFVSLPELWSWIRQSPLEHWRSFLFVLAFTALLYLNFAFFREQLCIIICPYGRFQSALLDDHTKNVAYDYQRGNPPGPVRDPKAGDCIDCHRCIQVCPTGIDIRQGIQLECIACTACIDACDEIMEKVNRPKGLIRYASDVELQGGRTRWIRPRTILYTALMLLGAGVATYAFSTIDAATATATRMPGSPFYVTDTHVRNQYQVRLINKDSQPLTFSVIADPGEVGFPIQTTGFQQSVTLQPMEERNATFVVQVPRRQYAGSFPLQIHVTAQPGSIRISEEVEFLGPSPRLLKDKAAEASQPNP